MNKHFTPLFLFAILGSAIQFTSCQESNKGNNTDPTEYSQPADTLLKKEIEVEVDSINSKIRQSTHFYKIPLPIHSPEDTLEYWNVNKVPGRISLKVYPEEMMIWPTFFVQDTDLVLVRLRTWSKKQPMPWARESMIYLRDGKIFYCTERRMDLVNNDIPASLRDKPFLVADRPFSEIQKEYQDYWDKIQMVLHSLPAESD